MKLDWLPRPMDWPASLMDLARSSAVWRDAVTLSCSQLNATQTNALDRVVREKVLKAPVAELAAAPLRLAILSSCTTTHLHAAIRTAGMRRNLWLDIYEPDYAQYRQALLEPGPLEDFAPTSILLSLDAHHLAAGAAPGMTKKDADAALSNAAAQVRECWRFAERFGCPIIQSIPLPLHSGLIGNNEHRLAGSRATFIRRLSEQIREMADAAGIDLLSLDARAAIDGIADWHDPDLWFEAKMEVSPRAAPAYGELLVRLLAARLGLSKKCLVLDLDNTLWGGAIGDVGLEDIELGQGSASGEAFLAVQTYARELSQRGVILAVCSKNDERNALEAFDCHPEMVLRRADIASFVANWNDKAANLRLIAKDLNIGLDALVLLDDNPFERALVRRELPMVAVPEVSDDPSTYPRRLEDAGYFEAARITEEDRTRGASYRGNAERARLNETSTDLASYLASLQSQLTWRPFDRLGLTRIVQLSNKTNQFNLTTQRYAEADVLSIIDDPRRLGLQFRLEDRFGDNGMIAIVEGRVATPDTLVIENWLMSCRVLGRGVEMATLSILVDQAKRAGVERLVGRYRPTAKNNMVRDHYPKLGFSPVECGTALGEGADCYELLISGHEPATFFITVREELAA